MYAFNNEILISKLKEQNVYLTQNRIAVFKLLTESKTAMSVSLIMKQSEILLDRISVYRALRCFLQKGIVEIVPNSKGNAMYILSAAQNGTAGSRDSKCAYFVCSGCHYTGPVSEPINIKPYLLTKHKVSKFSIILEGLCNNCK